MLHPLVRRVRRTLCALGVLTFAGLHLPLAARAYDAPGIARIGAVVGNVAIRHGDSSEDMAVVLNAPLEAGDYLSTGGGGRAEVQLDGYDAIRVDERSQVRFTQLDGTDDVAQLAIGTIEMRVFDGSTLQLRVQTPSVDVVPARSGAYVVKVDARGNTYVTARRGRVTVVTPQGSQDVVPGSTMEIAGSAADPEYKILAAGPETGFDRWNNDRDRIAYQVASLAPYEYLDPAIAGAADLAQNGDWVNVQGQGEAWHPRDESPDWTPYSDGSWSYEPYYGYTWVGDEPWGWAPYHYGRWFFVDGIGWVWSPGARASAFAWAPALVAFFEFGNGDANIGWVPLAPGEDVQPWWGPSSTTIVYNTTVVINQYQNVNRDIVALNVTRWHNGDFRDVRRVPIGSVTHVRTIGRIPLAPSPANYRFGPARAKVPVMPSRFAPIARREPIPVVTVPVHTWTRFQPVRAVHQPVSLAPIYRRSAPVYRMPQPAPRHVAPVYSHPSPIHRRSAPVYRMPQPAPRHVAPVYSHPSPIHRRSAPIERSAPVRRVPAARHSPHPLTPHGPLTHVDTTRSAS